MSTRVNEVATAVGVALWRLESLFHPDAQLTFIARLPGNPEADVLITKDSLVELEQLLARSRGREERMLTDEEDE